jgi:hypothetical protein
MENTQFNETAKYELLDRKGELKTYEVFKNQPTEEKPYIIESYPYGFLRTQKKVWIETTTKGDRLVEQTLNPKTNLWNSPKKSTYDDLNLLVIDTKTGYITSVLGLYSYSEIETFNKVKDFILTNNINLNENQKKQIKRVEIITKIMDKVTVEFKPVEFKHKITGEIKTQIDLMELRDYERVETKEENIISFDEVYNKYEKGELK